MHRDVPAASAPTAVQPGHGWWRGAVIYQIYPRSFLDTTGDGVGDLRGITRGLDYIADLGVDAIWLSPFFPSPMQDFGYDVLDHHGVDPMFGSLGEFDELVREAHGRGLRVLIDLVLSHTSDRHPWFIESRQSRSNPKADWYIWADPKADGTPPNNWLSVFGGPAWEWDTRRRQYYMHNFLTCQPDLNFHNPDVQDALLDIARYWLDRGVDGFRLDTVNMYAHDPALRDNPPLPAGRTVTGVPAENPLAMQEPVYNINRPETLGFLERLRALLDRYGDTATVGEIGVTADAYGLIQAYTTQHRLHMAYSFDFLGTDFSAAHVRRAVERLQDSGGGAWPNWAFSNHDVPRVMTRWGLEDETAAAPLLVALSTCLRGSACVYQGEELGLPEAAVPYEQLQDPYGIRFWPAFKGRDGCRTPMPWTSAPGQGFTRGRPWLPIPASHRARAVDRQAADPDSVLNRIRRFLHWRKGVPALWWGDIRFLDVPEPALAFERAHADGRLLCAMNLSGHSLEIAPAAGPIRALLTPGGFETAAQATSAGIRLEPWGAAFAPLPPR